MLYINRRNGEMNYVIVKEKFLKEYPDYKHDVDNFTEYLESQWKNSLEDETIRFMIQGLDVEFVLKSLIYNVEITKKYKSKTTAKRYATVIGQYFNYIRRTTEIDNPKLFDAISFNRSRENTYMKRMVAYIENCDLLMGIVEREPLERGEVEKILKWPDEQFERSEWEDITLFRKAMVAIAIKMMLLFGITYRELRRLQWSAYDEKYGFINLNGFEVRLPRKLSVELKQLKAFVEQNGIRNAEDIIFTDNSGQQWADTTSNSGIPDCLEMLLGVKGVTSVVKYGISQLLKAGLSDSVIKKMTGASDKLIRGCFMHEDEELDKIINNKLVTVDLYYEF